MNCERVTRYRNREWPCGNRTYLGTRSCWAHLSEAERAEAQADYHQRERLRRAAPELAEALRKLALAHATLLEELGRNEGPELTAAIDILAKVTGQYTVCAAVPGCEVGQ